MSRNWPPADPGSPHQWRPAVPQCRRPESARRSRHVALLSAAHLPCPMVSTPASSSHAHASRLPEPPAVLNDHQCKRVCSSSRSSSHTPRSRRALEWVNQQIQVVEQRRFACEKQKWWLSNSKAWLQTEPTEEAPGSLIEGCPCCDKPVPHNEVDALRYWLHRFGVDHEDALLNSQALHHKTRVSILESEQVSLKKKLKDLRHGKLFAPEAGPEADMNFNSHGSDRNLHPSERRISRCGSDVGDHAKADVAAELEGQISTKGARQEADVQAADSCLRQSANEPMRPQGSISPTSVEESPSAAAFQMRESAIWKLDEARASLDAAKASLEEDWQELRREVKAAVVNIVDQHQVSTCENDLEEAQRECRVAKSFSQQSALECMQLSEQSAEWQQEAAMQSSRIEELRGALAESRWRTEQIEMEKRVLDGSRSSQNRRILDLERDLVRARISGNESAKLKRRVEELEHSAREEQSARKRNLRGMAELEAQLMSASAHEEKCRRESSAQRDCIERLEQLLAAAQSDASKVAQLEEQLARACASEELLEHRLEEHVQQVSAVETKAKSRVSVRLMGDLADQLAESRALEEVHAHAHHEHQQSAAVMKWQLATAQTAKDETNKKHQALLLQVARLEQERDDTHDLEKAQAEQNGALRQQLAHLEHQAETLEHVQGLHVQECKMYQGQIVELESELVESQSALRSMPAVEELERELTRANATEEQLSHQNKAQQQRILELESKLIHLDGIEEMHGVDKQASQSEIAELQRALESVRHAEESAHKHGQALQERAVQLERELAEQQEVLEKHSQHHDAQLVLRERAHTLEAELTEHQKIVEEQTQQHDDQQSLRERTFTLEVELTEQQKVVEKHTLQHDEARAEIDELARELQSASEANSEVQQSEEFEQHIADLQAELACMRQHEKSSEKHMQTVASLQKSLAAAREAEQRLRRQDMTHKSQIRKLESQLNIPSVKMAVISSMYDDGDEQLGGNDATPLQLFA